MYSLNKFQTFIIHIFHAASNKNGHGLPHRFCSIVEYIQTVVIYIYIYNVRSLLVLRNTTLSDGQFVECERSYISSFVSRFDKTSIRSMQKPSLRNNFYLQLKYVIPCTFYLCICVCTDNFYDSIALATSRANGRTIIFLHHICTILINYRYLFLFFCYHILCYITAGLAYFFRYAIIQPSWDRGNKRYVTLLALQTDERCRS